MVVVEGRGRERPDVPRAAGASNAGCAIVEGEGREEDKAAGERSGFMMAGGALHRVFQWACFSTHVRISTEMSKLIWTRLMVKSLRSYSGSGK